MARSTGYVLQLFREQWMDMYCFDRSETIFNVNMVSEKRGRGRPRKNPIPVANILRRSSSASDLPRLETVNELADIMGEIQVVTDQPQASVSNNLQLQPVTAEEEATSEKYLTDDDSGEDFQSEKLLDIHRRTEQEKSLSPAEINQRLSTENDIVEQVGIYCRTRSQTTRSIVKEKVTGNLLINSVSDDQGARARIKNTHAKEFYEPIPRPVPVSNREKLWVDYNNTRVPEASQQQHYQQPQRTINKPCAKVPSTKPRGECTSKGKVTLENCPVEWIKLFGEYHEAKIKTRVELLQLFTNLLLLENNEAPTRFELNQMDIQELKQMQSPEWICELRRFGILENELYALLTMGITSRRRLTQRNLLDLKAKLGPVLVNTLIEFLEEEKTEGQKGYSNEYFNQREERMERDQPTRVVFHGEGRVREQQSVPVREISRPRTDNDSYTQLLRMERSQQYYQPQGETRGRNHDVNDYPMFRNEGDNRNHGFSYDNNFNLPPVHALPNIGLPPYVKGKIKPLEWIRLVRQKLEIYPCHDYYKTLALKLALGGELLLSWQAIKAGNPDLEWNELLDRLTETAAPESARQQAYYALHTLKYKMGEDFERFLERHEEARMICDPQATDLAQRNYLINSLFEELKRSIIKKVIYSYEELKIAIRIKLNNLNYDKRRRPETMSNTYNSNNNRNSNAYRSNNQRRYPPNIEQRSPYRNNYNQFQPRYDGNNNNSSNNNNPNWRQPNQYQHQHRYDSRYQQYSQQRRPETAQPDNNNNNQVTTKKVKEQIDSNQNVPTVPKQVASPINVEEEIKELNNGSNHISNLIPANHNSEEAEESQEADTQPIITDESANNMAETIEEELEDLPVNQKILPGIKLKIYNNNQCVYSNVVLCDTGSPVSIISEKVLKDLSCEIYHNDSILSGIVNGVQLPIIGYLYLLMKLNDEYPVKSVKFLVTTQNDVGVLLGSNFTWTFDAYPHWAKPNRFYTVLFDNQIEPKGGHLLHVRPHNEKELATIKESYLETEGEKLVPIKKYNDLDRSESVYRIYHILNEDDLSFSNMIKATINPKLDQQKKNELFALMWEFSDIFSRNNDDLGCVPHTETNIKIPLKGRVPYKNPYPCSPDRRIHFQHLIDDMMNSGIIQKSVKSPGGAPALLVPKKDGTFRLVVDFRELNKVVEKTPGPMPRIEDSMSALAGKKFFCVLDLNQGYYQLEIPPEERWKTAFNTPDGKYEFCRLPMGYTDAPYEFQMLINRMLDGIMYKNALGYFDDLISFGSNWKEFLDNTRLLFERIRNYGLKAKTAKCQAGIESTVFLGHVVDGHGIKPNPKKIDAIKALKHPTNIKQLKSNLGLFTFLSRYILNYSTLIEPLLRLTKKDAKFEFGIEQQEAFESVRTALMNDCMLVHFNPKAQLKLSTDASDKAIGGILLQEEAETDENGKIKSNWRPISYYSQTLMKYQHNYTVSEKELLAILVGISKFHHYLGDKMFTIETDHHALCQLPNLTFKNNRLNRWALLLQGYNYKVVHVKGETHAPDCLTRNCEWSHRKPTIIDDELEDQIFQIIELNNDLNEFELQEIVNEKSISPYENKVSIIQIPSASESHVAQEQAKDNEYKQIKLILGDPKYHHRKDVKRKFKLINGIIYRQSDHYHSNPRLVITKSMFEKIFHEYHDKREGGHFGATKTYNNISERYWHENLKELIMDKVAKCRPCLFYKGVQATFMEPQKKGVETHPLNKLELDVAGPIKRSNKGNEYIIIAVDSLSRYTFASPAKDQTARTVISFLENIFYQYGVPKIIQSDQGTNFTSNEFAEMCKHYGIQHNLSSPYHPQSNGLVERMNRVIGEKIKIYCDNNSTSKWDVDFNQILFGINTQIHSITKFSPFYLLHGYHARRRLDNLTETLSPMTDVNADRLKARERLEQSQETIYNNSQASARKANYSIGDLILVQLKASDPERGKKLKGNYTGPYIVLEYDHGHVHAIPLLEEAIVSKSNVSNTKKFTGQLSEKEEDKVKELCLKYNIPFEHLNDDKECKDRDNSNCLIDAHQKITKHPKNVSTSQLAGKTAQDKGLTSSAKTVSDNLTIRRIKSTKVFAKDFPEKNFSFYLKQRVTWNDPRGDALIAPSTRKKANLASFRFCVPQRTSSVLISKSPDYINCVSFNCDISQSELINTHSTSDQQKFPPIIKFRNLINISDIQSVRTLPATLTFAHYKMASNQPSRRNSTSSNSDINQEKRDYKRLILEKLSENYFMEDVRFKFEFGQPPKGFNRQQVYHPYLGNIIQKLQCYLCEHIAIEPILCSQCSKLYCTKCANWLHNLPFWMDAVPCADNEFVCLFRDCIKKANFTKPAPIDEDLSRRFSLIRYKCRHLNCSMKFDMYNILAHEQYCCEGIYNWKPDLTLFSLRGFRMGRFTLNYKETHRPQLNDFVLPTIREEVIPMDNICIDNKKLRNGVNWPYSQLEKDRALLRTQSFRKDLKAIIIPSEKMGDARTPSSIDRPIQNNQAIKVNKTQIKEVSTITNKEGWEWPKDNNDPWKTDNSWPQNEPKEDFKKPSAPAKKPCGNHGRNYPDRSNNRCLEKGNDYHISTYPKRPKYTTQSSFEYSMQKAQNRSSNNNSASEPMETIDWQAASENSKQWSPNTSCFSYQSKFDDNKEKPFIKIPIWDNMTTDESVEYKKQLSKFSCYKAVYATPSEEIKQKKRSLHSTKVNQLALANWKKRTILEDKALDGSVGDTIKETASKIEKKELPIIAIKIECCKAKDTGYGKGKPAPIWVAIVNHEGTTVYESFIKQQQKAIVDMLTDFHGLEYSDIKYGKSENATRYVILEYLTAAKVIIGFALETQFRVLGILSEDITLLQRKCRDLNVYYSPYTKLPCNKHAISFLAFGKKVTKIKPFTPVAEANVAMKLYLFRKPHIERLAIINSGITNHCLTKILPNMEMRQKLQDLMHQEVETSRCPWPDEWMRLIGSKYAINLPFWHNDEVRHRQLDEEVDRKRARRERRMVISSSSSSLDKRSVLDHRGDHVMISSQDPPSNASDDHDNNNRADTEPGPSLEAGTSEFNDYVENTINTFNTVNWDE